MDGAVLLLYLRDLRDLEIAKKKIEEIYNNEKYVCLGCFFIISVWIAKELLSWSHSWSGTFIKDILFIVGMIIGISSFAYLFLLVKMILDIIKRKTNNTNNIIMAKQ